MLFRSKGEQFDGTFMLEDCRFTLFHSFPIDDDFVFGCAGDGKESLFRRGIFFLHQCGFVACGGGRSVGPILIDFDVLVFVAGFGGWVRFEFSNSATVDVGIVDHGVFPAEAFAISQFEYVLVGGISSEDCG